MLCTECRKRESYLDGICKPCLDSMRDESEVARAEYRAYIAHKAAQKYVDTAPAECDPEAYEFLGERGSL